VKFEREGRESYERWRVRERKLKRGWKAKGV